MLEGVCYSEKISRRRGSSGRPSRKNISIAEAEAAAQKKLPELYGNNSRRSRAYTMFFLREKGVQRDISGILQASCTQLLILLRTPQVRELIRTDFIRHFV